RRSISSGFMRASLGLWPAEGIDARGGALERSARRKARDQRAQLCALLKARSEPLAPLAVGADQHVKQKSVGTVVRGEIRARERDRIADAVRLHPGRELVWRQGVDRNGED